MRSDYIKMNCKLETWKVPRVVHVYDFMHETIETFQTFALCWCPWNESWITVAVAYLSPIIDKKILNEVL